MLARINFQLLSFLTLIILAAVHETVMAWYGVEPSKAFDYLSAATISYFVAIWVEKDRSEKGISAPFEYAAFMFFMWPFLAPYYLFKTRRWKGLGFGFGFMLIIFAPSVIATILLMIFGE